MSRLTIEHLAPYLPYGLRIKEENCEFEMNGSFLDEWFNYGEMTKGKPILRPIEDVCFINVDLHQDDVAEIRECIEEDNIEYMRHDLFMKLVKNHFDVFGLIEQGLAIDINTLKSH